MQDKPDFLQRGERARLFPTLADTSKEGRTASIFLACLANVYEYAQAMLSPLGRRVGSRASIETYTEVSFSLAKGEKNFRPDGLIVLKIGSRRWTALVEAKVGNSDLGSDQVEAYLEIAKNNGIDAVITVSNQFVSKPSQSPVCVSQKLLNKVDLFHWSWMSVLTEANLLLDSNGITDSDQRFILSEMVRFFAHPSAGVQGFDSMPAAWPSVVQTVTAGGVLNPKSDEAQSVIAAWHQEVRDLSLIMSRRTGRKVSAKLSRAHATDENVRVKDDIEELSKSHVLRAMLDVPDTAAAIEIALDVKAKTVTNSVRLRAPADKQSTKARLRWLLRQLPDGTSEADIYIRLHWPGRGSHTQYRLDELQSDVDLAVSDRPGQQVHSFEVCCVESLGRRFSGRKTFIEDFEKMVPAFYENFVQGLKAWQPPAPKLQEDRLEQVDEREAIVEG